MKIMKTWIASVLALVMVLGLAGCLNREPTAKALIEGMPAIDPEKYYDMSVDMKITAEADGQPSNLVMSFGAEGSGDIMHLYDVDLSLGISGISIAFSMEGWMEAAENTMYCRMTLFGEDSGWMLLDMDSDPDTFPAESFQEMIGGMGSLGKTSAELVLEPHSEGEDYVVTWTENELDAGGLSGSFSSLLGGFAADGQTTGADQPALGSAMVQAHFDEETHELKFIRIEAETDGSGNSSNIGVTITLHAVNGDQKLNVPQSVVDTAVDVSDFL